MKYDWIIDVIADLERFSTANNMRELSAELAEVKLIAAVEIAMKEKQEGMPTLSKGDPQRPH